MMNKVLAAFALKEEFGPWRRRHRFARQPDEFPPVEYTTLGSSEVWAVLVGTGAREAPRLFELTSRLAPSFGIVTGVAAGLKPQWRTGDVLAARTVVGPDGAPAASSDPRLVELAAQCGAKAAPAFITLPHIARRSEEKSRLADCADAADMESLPLMQRWAAAGIPSLALRVILDPVEMPLTCDFEAAMDAHGQIRIAPLLAQLARRPRLLPGFLHLARRNHRAVKILAGFLDRFFELLDREHLSLLRRQFE